MKQKLTAFLSASAQPEDKKIVEWFSNLLKRLEIQPVFATDLPEPRPPPEKIKNLIQKSNMFVGVLTKREKIEGKDLWKAPDWVQNEITIAYTLKKPIALFIENGVHVDQSIGPFLVDCVRFDRDNLALVRTQAQKYIRELRKNVGLPIYTQPEQDEISGTIVDGIDEGFMDVTIIKLARMILIKRYGRLNVSLTRFFVVSILVFFALIPLIYDYLFGARLFGSVGIVVATIGMVLIFSILSVASTTRCKECESYFSERQKPITYADIRNFPDLPKNRRLLNCLRSLWQCKV